MAAASASTTGVTETGETEKGVTMAAASACVTGTEETEKDVTMAAASASTTGATDTDEREGDLSPRGGQGGFRLAQAFTLMYYSRQ